MMALYGCRFENLLRLLNWKVRVWGFCLLCLGEFGEAGIFILRVRNALLYHLGYSKNTGRYVIRNSPSLTPDLAFIQNYCR